MKIAIIGAGSSYTSEIIEDPAQMKDRLPVIHLSLMNINPLHQPSVPQAVWGLVSAVKNYEQLTVEAAFTGSRKKVLLAHPLVGEYETAMPLLDEMLEANRAYLPLFFPEQDKIE